MKTLVFILLLFLVPFGCCTFYPCAIDQMDSLNEQFLNGEITLDQYNAAYEKLAPAYQRDLQTFSYGTPPAPPWYVPPPPWVMVPPTAP